MKTIEQKVLQNVMEDMQKEMHIFENEKNKTKGFYSDYSNISYTLYLNSIARIKEVLCRMSINNENNS